MSTARQKYRLLVGALAIIIAAAWAGKLPSIPWTPRAAYSDLSNHPILAVPDLPNEDTGHDTYMWYSDARIRRLAGCTALRNCPRNAEKVVIVIAYHCHAAKFLGYFGGEGVWCMSMMDSFEKQGYTVLYARDDWDYALHIYRQIPDHVYAIIGREDGKSSFRNSMKTEKRPWGIPAWKFFIFSYFPSIGGSIVGDQWTIVGDPGYDPLQPKNFTFIGYALSKVPYVPAAERPHRVYVLGKKIAYFHDVAFSHPMWPTAYYARAVADLKPRWPDFEFVAAVVPQSGEEADRDGVRAVPEGIRLLDKLTPEKFDLEVAQSRLQFGIGYPLDSPSPYRALASGVPFSNSITLRKGGNNEDFYTWDFGQHATLRQLKPPLVYHTEGYNYNAFLDTITAAMENPIEPFRFDWMSQESLDQRVHQFMTTDWRAEAARILELRKQGIETQKGPNLIQFML